LTPDVVARFWAKVDKRGPDECWEWTAGKWKNTGYGAFVIGTSKDHYTHGAHRVAYTIQHEEIPDKLFVCHKCDNRLCMNGSHLFLGTYLDNIKDMVSKGRNAKGERSWVNLYPERRLRGEASGLHKVTEANVREIRQLAANFTFTELGIKFGISRVSIANIIKKKTWTHL
jgi:hypothetical protein